MKPIGGTADASYLKLGVQHVTDLRDTLFQIYETPRVLQYDKGSTFWLERLLNDLIKAP